jgi:hypothetical protein
MPVGLFDMLLYREMMLEIDARVPFPAAIKHRGVRQRMVSCHGIKIAQTMDRTLAIFGRSWSMS